MSRSESLEFLISALEAIEYVHSENGYEYCPWCGNLSPADWDQSGVEYKQTHPNGRGHRKDCLRQVALRKAQFGT